MFASATTAAVDRSTGIERAQGRKSVVIARLQDVSTTQVDCSGLRETPGIPVGIASAHQV